MNEELSNAINLNFKVNVKKPREPWELEDGVVYRTRWQIGCTEGTCGDLSIGLSAEGSVYCVMDLKTKTATAAIGGASGPSDPRYHSVRVMNIVSGEARYYNRYPIAPAWESFE